ncbi:hypothetical protein SAMN05880574_12143 [Chryseobacterium sp. RU37D]|uniref:hypothetical protein n=1 Tax=Chryseobacterium sp. RU37D TaxID=1907397 RepID=UPI00095648CD|nr:hypothetical protein [Chryseobacterium sp. RU37D]SIQ69785.1 hypothetical protein SAMN05880574_12143 [Chryseobacterium sp. RU37D]
MNKSIIFFVFFLVLSIAKAQIGINTATPKTTLDISAKNSNGTTAEGMLIPRLKGYEIRLMDSQMGIDQNSALLYATEADSTPSSKTINITAPGYYYYDAANSIWKALTPAIPSVDTTNDAFVNDNTNAQVTLGTLSDGNTTRPSGTEFSIKDNGNIAIGTANNPVEKLDVRGGIYFGGNATDFGKANLRQGIQDQEFGMYEGDNLIAGTDPVGNGTNNPTFSYGFVTNGSGQYGAKIRINQNTGYIGINTGTSEPAAQLQVGGDVLVKGTNNANFSNFQVYNPSGNSYMQFGAYPSNPTLIGGFNMFLDKGEFNADLRVFANPEEGFNIQNGNSSLNFNNSAMNWTTPYFYLNASNGNGLEVAGKSLFALNNGSSESFKITSDGNTNDIFNANVGQTGLVGINTNSPIGRLTIGGNYGTNKVTLLQDNTSYDSINFFIQDTSPDNFGNDMFNMNPEEGMSMVVNNGDNTRHIEVIANSGFGAALYCTDNLGNSSWLNVLEDAVHIKNKAIIGNVPTSTTPNSTLEIAGSVAANIRTLNSGTIADDDYTVLATASISLPDPTSSNRGRIYHIINDTSGNINISGTFRINGSNLSYYELDNSDLHKGIMVQSTGSAWVIL